MASYTHLNNILSSQDTKELIAWIEKQGENNADAIHTILKDEDGTKTSDLVAAFGKCLSHYLDKTKYPAEPTAANPRDTKKRKRPAYNHETAIRLTRELLHPSGMERSLPYDALLVGSWLTGENPPEKEAWEEIRHYFEAQPESVPSGAIAMMDALYEAIELRMQPHNRHYPTETQRTLKCRLDAAGIDIQKLSDKDIPTKAGAKLASKCELMQFNRKILTIPHINMTHPYARNKLTLPICYAYDAVLTEKSGKFASPSLCELHWQSQYEQARLQWQQADGFGEKLGVLLQLTQLSGRDLAQQLGTSNALVSLWLNEKIRPNTSSPVCPTEKQLDKLLTLLRYREGTLLDAYGIEIESFITEDRLSELKQARKQLYEGHGNRRPQHFEWNDTLLAEIAVLHRDFSLLPEQISKLYPVPMGAISIQHGLAKARRTFGCSYENLTDEMGNQARKRISQRLSERDYPGTGLDTQVARLKERHPAKRDVGR